jgi:hypothetical protein
MRKTTFIVGAVALLAVGALFASNMGFKLNYNLAASGDPVPDGTSASGNNVLALPFNAQTGLTDSAALFDDIGSAAVFNISQFVQSNNGYNTYGVGGTPFALNPGEGYFVRMNPGFTTDYIVVGSHDPSASITLSAAGDPVPGGTSASGNNLFSPPYHITATDAQQLADDIGSLNVFSISRFNEATNGYETFTPGSVGPFSIVPGKAYFVRMTTTVNYTPSHY